MTAAMDDVGELEDAEWCSGDHLSDRDHTLHIHVATGRPTHISFSQELAHLQRITLNLAAHDSSRKVYGREHEHGVLPCVRFYTPALRADVDNPSNHQVTDLGDVARLQGLDRDELVDSLHGPRDGGDDRVALNVCAVATAC